MDKKEFLKQLQKALTGLSQEDVNERLNFYSEMIDDYVEEGLTEAEAVSRIGSVNDIAAQIIEDTPLSKIAKERFKSSGQLGALVIILLIFGSPIWLSLLISTFTVVIALYVALWSAIISLWSAFVSLAACAIGGIWGGIVFAITGHGMSGAALFGASLVCAGFSILAFFCCKAATKGATYLTKKPVLLIKNRLMKKEDAKNA